MSEDEKEPAPEEPLIGYWERHELEEWEWKHTIREGHVPLKRIVFDDADSGPHPTDECLSS